MNWTPRPETLSKLQPRTVSALVEFVSSRGEAQLLASEFLGSVTTAEIPWVLQGILDAEIKLPGCICEGAIALIGFIELIRDGPRILSEEPTVQAESEYLAGLGTSVNDALKVLKRRQSIKEVETVCLSVVSVRDERPEGFVEAILFECIDNSVESGDFEVLDALFRAARRMCSSLPDWNSRLEPLARRVMQSSGQEFMQCRVAISMLVEYWATCQPVDDKLTDWLVDIGPQVCLEIPYQASRVEHRRIRDLLIRILRRWQFNDFDLFIGVYYLLRIETGDAREPMTVDVKGELRPTHGCDGLPPETPTGPRWRETQSLLLGCDWLWEIATNLFSVFGLPPERAEFAKVGRQ